MTTPESEACRTGNHLDCAKCSCTCHPKHVLARFPPAVGKRIRSRT